MARKGEKGRERRGPTSKARGKGGREGKGEGMG